MTRTLITVPMKDPSTSKTRLSGALDDTARIRLARLLFQRTLEFLTPVGDQAGADLAVVTGSDTVTALACQAGFSVIAEPDHTTLTGAVTHAAEWARAQGYDRICIIPADLAAPLQRDVLIFLSSDADVTICPSTDRGTNALLVSPATAIPFRFGPRSALLHRAEAEALGLDVRLMPLDSLSFDIDTTACLTRAATQVPDLAGFAP
ncbi:MAG: 2-phospho-L-lactate guanylyltransferase [Paracoccaceae bacterium]